MFDRRYTRSQRYGLELQGLIDEGAIGFLAIGEIQEKI